MDAGLPEHAAPAGLSTARHDGGVDVNLTDWMGQHKWALWAALALLLASAEMLTLEFTLLMLAVGALAGGITAVIVPHLVAVQILVALVVSGVTLGFLRPTLLRRVRNAPGYRSSLQKLVGSEALVTRQVTAGGGGEVKVDGDIWQAVPVDPDMVIEPGEKVDIYEVDGTTLKVYGHEKGTTPWAT